ncbi:MAG: hypothetical protein ACRENE_35575 [Polyangiaceae bacterium]
MLTARTTLAFAARGLALLLASACGGSIIIVGDGGASGGGDDGSGSSSGQANGDDGSGGTAGGTSGGTNVVVDPCPSGIPELGSVCEEPGHICGYTSIDTTGNSTCYPVLCDATSHWQYSNSPCP